MADDRNDSQIEFIDSLNKLGNWKKAYLPLLLVLLLLMIGYSGYLGISLFNNITKHKKCKNKPSATDATITCPNQNGTTSAAQTNPYYLSSEGKPIPITTFYGAVDVL
jgi:zona occludens toxin (predicted ATPase)